MTKNTERVRTPFDDGVIVAIDKPLQWTSFDLVNKFRYILCRRLGVKKFKVGHAGTLDPLATGVVLLCTGKATKDIERLQAERKEYLAEIRLGASTPSFDLETEVDTTAPTQHISKNMVEETLQRFVGVQMQVPPTFSACKVDGKRAYDYARQGREITLRAKEIVVHNIELLHCMETVEEGVVSIEIRVVCGKGTYIRALARDIGMALGSCAHLTALRRTRSGIYSATSTISVEEIGDYIEKILLDREER